MRIIISTFALFLYSIPVFAQSLTLDKLDLHGVVANTVTYQGRSGVRLTESDPASGSGGLAFIRETSFQDGTIEVDLTGDTAPDAAPALRGFVGVAFRVLNGGSQYECFYLRPKNGRSADQLQRNHSAQYISVPGFPWEKLRAETPGKYESYVDLVPGQWTHLKIQVKGSTARLYAGDAQEPVLIVNDLKQTPAKGGIGLWIGPGTIAHFANLKVNP